MNKGFTLKSFLIVLGLVVFMILIAFFVQRKEKEPLITENGITEEELIFEEAIEFDIDNQESEFSQNNNDNDEEKVIDYQDAEIVAVDCGRGNYLAFRAKQDLALRTGVLVDKITVISCQENFFSDHTLGNSGPGEVYPQTLTFGYVIILSLNRQEYRYHINDDTISFVY